MNASETALQVAEELDFLEESTQVIRETNLREVEGFLLDVEAKTVAHLTYPIEIRESEQHGV